MPERPTIVFDEEVHKYTVNGEVFPSVTTIIKGVVPMPFSAAAWWGWKLGVQATHDVLRPSHWRNHPPTAEQLEQKCKDESDYRPDRVLKSAGQRGTDFHEAIHEYAASGLIVVDDFPEEDRKVVKGLMKWLYDNDVEFITQEIVTASLTHRFAGTCDAYVRFHAGEWQGLTARIDWKTSKSIYPEQHFPQVAAYEMAEVECGEESSDLQGVVHLPVSGRVKMKVSDYTPEDFCVLLAHHEMLQRHA